MIKKLLHRWLGDEIRFVGDIERITPQPGDCYVLRIEQPLPPDQRDRIAAQMKVALRGARCIVLTEGMSLGVIGAIPETETLGSHAK